MSQIDILISEVGPRDGLQSIESIMSTQDKKNWIQAEAKAGVREIEVGSFVPAKLLPQMADTAELVRYAKTIPNLTVAALVPNFIGAKNAIDAGVDKMCLPLSVSETHSKANLKKNHSQVLEEVKIISQYIKTLDENDRPEFEGNLSTAFGCTLEGKVSEKAVVSLGVKMMDWDAMKWVYRTQLAMLILHKSRGLFDCLKKKLAMKILQVFTCIILEDWD